MKKNEDDSFNFIFILHVIIIISIIVIIILFLNSIGQRNFNKIVKNTENIYKEKLEDTEKISNEFISKKEKAKPFEKYNFKYSYTIDIKGNINNFIFKVPLPSDEPEKQYISALKISPTPTRTYHDGINNIAEYKYDKLSISKINITLEGIANIRTYDLNTAKILNKNISKEKDLTQYLKPSPLIESDDPLIKRVANRIEGESKEEIVANIYEYIQKTIKYTPITQDIGAKKVLKHKRGKCSEYAALMVALCRARNIPARIVCGNIARDSFQKHTWVEVYFDKFGWILYDPTTTISNINFYNNGRLIRKEHIINADKMNLKYITSSRNEFSPWSLTYSSEERTTKDMSVIENIKIEKYIK